MLEALSVRAQGLRWRRAARLGALWPPGPSQRRRGADDGGGARWSPRTVATVALGGTTTGAKQVLVDRLKALAEARSGPSGPAPAPPKRAAAPPPAAAEPAPKRGKAAPTAEQQHDFLDAAKAGDFERVKELLESVPGLLQASCVGHGTGTLRLAAPWAAGRCRLRSVGNGVKFCSALAGASPGPRMAEWGSEPWAAAGQPGGWQGSPAWQEAAAGAYWHAADEGWGDPGWQVTGPVGAWGGQWGWAEGGWSGGAGSGQEPWQAQLAAPSLGNTDEHTASVHYGKTFSVLSEVLEKHPAAFQGVSSFLDLGCAPGGFAGRLLEQFPAAQGYGVTIPREAGGFPVLICDERFHIQLGDLMQFRSPDELDCPQGVDVCMADAQDLGRRTNPAGREQEAGRGRGRRAREGGRGGKAAKEVGVQAACSVLGIWALTLQELLLAFGRLRGGGTLLFRFGWRGRGANEEAWYREATVKLFALLMTYFSGVAPCKSEFSHQAHSSFYVVASGFNFDAYSDADLGRKLRESIDHIVGCERPVDLPWCMEEVCPAEFATPALRERISALLDSVGKLRAIGMATRQHLEASGRETGDATIFISPVPFQLTMQRLRERLERFGQIANIRRRAHPVGVGADAVVHFTQAAHATNALEAIEKLKILGPSVTAKRISEGRGR
ncbi:unnamed protein product [Prorocentrum cordatum]|uniref:RRM domain-containing protein n=1 Tax=Prorocentrum cordatum TaxID=2364126 RepID=A0ABN9TY30_9DINO|nr:unnamed protein product [Polarella glacialis]